jgi:hypothetical protein
LPSSDGGIAQRWILLYSELRQAQARRTVDKQWRQQSDKETKTFKKLCRTPFACEAEARQALSPFEQDLQTISLAASAVRAQPRYAQRGRPRPDAQPDQVVYQIDGALASALTARQALIDGGVPTMLFYESSPGRIQARTHQSPEGYYHFESRRSPWPSSRFVVPLVRTPT